jgi:hypothetical protein
MSEDNQDNTKIDDTVSQSNVLAANNEASNSGLGGGSSMNVGAVDNKNLTAEQKKIGSFPSDLSNIQPIFGLKSKNTQAKERFSQKAQEYLDSHKMSIYLQDAIKIILDRREEKPLDLLTD